jgi:hypothetical protein
MEKKRTIQMIVREGLVLLACLGIGYLIIITPYSYTDPKPIRIEPATTKLSELEVDDSREILQEDAMTGQRRIYRSSDVENAEKKQAVIVGIGFFILVLGYPIYLLARYRYVFWRVKAAMLRDLKSKDHRIKNIVRISIGIVFILLSIFVACDQLGWLIFFLGEGAFSFAMLYFLLLIADLLLAFAGISICINKISKWIIAFLTIGLIPTSLFLFKTLQ